MKQANSPHWSPYISYNTGWEKLSKYQANLSLVHVIIFYILMTCCVFDHVVMLQGDIIGLSLLNMTCVMRSLCHIRVVHIDHCPSLEFPTSVRTVTSLTPICKLRIFFLSSSLHTSFNFQLKLLSANKMKCYLQEKLIKLFQFN